MAGGIVRAVRGGRHSALLRPTNGIGKNISDCDLANRPREVPAQDATLRRRARRGFSGDGERVLRRQTGEKHRADRRDEPIDDRVVAMEDSMRSRDKRPFFGTGTTVR